MSSDKLESARLAAAKASPMGRASPNIPLVEFHF
jgi:hypothetical protein